ncbi:unnamed protein product [Leuciscus chuanchicus]
MRADSPGHSAKFGSYTLMDLQTNTVVDTPELVQSNEVGGSYHMEKGLQRSLALLEARGVTLEWIVTDRRITGEYLDDLQDLIFEHVFVDPAPYMDEVLKIPILSDLCAEYERPDKEEVISTMVSRFNHQLKSVMHLLSASNAAEFIQLLNRIRWDILTLKGF